MTADLLPSHRTRYRAALIELAQRSRFTHLLTLNTHRDCSLAAATKHLKRWRVEVFRHLHGYRFYKLPDCHLTWYMGCAEFTASGHPHFHLAAMVPENVTPKFELAADRRWCSIIPSGTSYLTRIGPEPDDQRRVLGYATKWLDAGADLPFIHSKVDW